MAQLPLSKNTNEKQLVIIAGVGGLLLIALLDKLFKLTQGINIEFLIAPVHHNYQVRSFLNTQDYSLIDERIVEENNRFYEVLHITKAKDKLANISLVGDKMWEANNAQHLLYLQQMIAHYQRIALNPQSDVDEIIKAYLRLLDRLKLQSR